MTLPLLIIPAYNPDDNLLKLVLLQQQLCPQQQCVVVNDGSSAECNELFESLEALGITILHHQQNRGKGEALKTGMRYFLDKQMVDSPGIITADADGQHCVDDILKLSQQLSLKPHQLHIGVRQTSQHKVPLRSRLGNSVTRCLFNQLTRNKVQDTQTGLRGIPINLIQAMISSKAAHYEFEFEMLFVAKNLGITISQTPIRTIYFNKNSNSHFNPLLDSLKIYYVFFRFCSVALVSFCIDFTFFCVIFSQFHHLDQAVFGARAISASVNFLLNKKTTFQSSNNIAVAAIKFSMLAVLIAFSSYYLLQLISITGINVYLGKILSDTALFFASFLIQYVIIFTRNRYETV